jgi:hypothetical protein
VVGYDNNRQAWLIKNSWGPRFADKGFAWVGFDAPSMCDPGDTYGFVFEPFLPPSAALQKLSPAAGRSGCFTYRAVAGDYPEALASHFGLRVQQLLLDNLGVIKEPSTVPAGATLLLCGAKRLASAALGGATAAGTSRAPTTGVVGAPTGANATNATDEVRVLLAIKRVLGPKDTALSDWQLGSRSPCGWVGVTCDAGSKQVTQISFWDTASMEAQVTLTGQLPSGTLLRLLPFLAVLNLQGTGVGGTLPEDWSLVTQLRVVGLGGNKIEGEEDNHKAGCMSACSWYHGALVLDVGAGEHQCGALSVQQSPSHPPCAHLPAAMLHPPVHSASSAPMLANMHSPWAGSLWCILAPVGRCPRPNEPVCLFAPSR